MIKIDLTNPIILLNGDVENDNGKPLTTGKLLSKFLAGSIEGDRIKFYDWAKKLYNGEPIEVDKSDFKTLYDFVKNSKTLNALGLGQIIQNIDECEAKSKEVK